VATLFCTTFLQQWKLQCLNINAILFIKLINKLLQSRYLSIRKILRFFYAYFNILISFKFTNIMMVNYFTQSSDKWWIIYKYYNTILEYLLRSYKYLNVLLSVFICKYWKMNKYYIRTLWPKYIGHRWSISKSRKNDFIDDERV